MKKIVNYERKKLNIFIFSSSIVFALALIIDILNLPPFIDEKNLVFNVVHFATNRTIIPYYTNYPTFYSCFIAIPIYFVFSIVYFLKGYPVGEITDVHFLKFVFMENQLLLFWVARMISIILSLSTFILLLKYASRRYGSVPSIIAAALIIFDPLNIYFTYSRFALPEILITFLLFTVILLCLKYI